MPSTPLPRNHPVSTAVRWGILTWPRVGDFEVAARARRSRSRHWPSFSTIRLLFFACQERDIHSARTASQTPRPAAAHRLLHANRVHRHHRLQRTGQRVTLHRNGAGNATAHVSHGPPLEPRCDGHRSDEPAARRRAKPTPLPAAPAPVVLCPSPPYPMAVEHTRNDSAVKCRMQAFVILARRVARPRPRLRPAPCARTSGNSRTRVLMAQ